MTPEIDEARGAALTAITQAATVADLERVVSEHLGKRGALAGLKKGLGGIVDPEARRAAGAAMHAARTAVEEAVEQRRDELAGAETEQRITEERLDLTEFRSDGSRGHLHIVTQAWQRLEDVFLGLGFSVAEGPEVETDWHNFEALNMGEGHPARGEFDTLFVDHVPPGGRLGTTLLRTHTSPVQIRRCSLRAPDLRRRPGAGVPARHPRRDAYAGLPPDRGTGCRSRNLDDRPRGNDRGIHQAFFGAGFTSRLRPSYFPFTEPSAEFDIQRPDGSWLELGGCGMVHPSVIRAGGLDPDEWSGFAFGFGIDRMAVMRHGVADIRDMYVNDIRFVEQF